MEILFAKVENVKISGRKNAWRILSEDEVHEKYYTCKLELEIQGRPKQGYNLVMSPEGFFTADCWYETKQEAFDDAKSMFGISEDQWTKEKKDAS